MATLKLTDVEKTYGGTVNVLNNISGVLRPVRTAPPPQQHTRCSALYSTCDAFKP